MTDLLVVDQGWWQASSAAGIVAAHGAFLLGGRLRAGARRVPEAPARAAA